MAIIPVRGLAEKGILHDPSPYQLDVNAWSDGANVRFHANRAERAPIFREVMSPLSTAPVFGVGLEATQVGQYDTVVYADFNGRLWQYANAAVAEVTEPGHVNVVDTRAWTSAVGSEVLYMNHPAAGPVYLGPNATQFQPMPNMETTWTCRSLRSFGDFMVAMNVTKPTTYVDPYTGLTVAGGAFTNMFKWSDLALEGQTPLWDPFNPNLSSGENPLEELRTPIVDGYTLRSIFVVYSLDQIWAVQQNGGQSIFNFYKLFDEGGMIAPNCVAEVDGLHYVFGPNDIYKHDGTSKVSIVDKRNREFIFRHLSVNLTEAFFVKYFPTLDSVVFAFNTGYAGAAYQNCTLCNYGAVYDISADTWSFIDLPNVASLSIADLQNVLTYADAPAGLDYSNTGSSYYDQSNPFVKNIVALSAQDTLDGILQSRILAYDFNDTGNLAFPELPECNPPAYLERTGVALDAEGSDLTTYKKIRRVFPLVYVYEGVPMLIEIGGSNTPAGPVTYDTAVMFDPTVDYKIDGIMGGRYLAIRFTVGGPQDFEVTGYDMDVTSGGRR